MVLPVSLGSTAVVMLLNGALWAPGLARVLDQSLRYTVDKTTREILFLPLPAAYQAQGQVVRRRHRRPDREGAWRADLARSGEAVGPAPGLAAPELCQPGRDGALDLHVAARPARAISRRSGRASSARDVVPDDVRLERRRSLDDRDARAGALAARSGAGDLRHRHARVARQAQPGHAAAALPRVARGAAAGAAGDRRRAERYRHAAGCRRCGACSSDPDSGVRAAAIVAIGAINNEDAATLSRPLLADPDSAHPRDRRRRARRQRRARATSMRPKRRCVDLAADAQRRRRPRRAATLPRPVRHIADPRFRRLLIPLLYDASPEVANEAMESVRGGRALRTSFSCRRSSSLLRNRRLKGAARQVLVSYGRAGRQRRSRISCATPTKTSGFGATSPARSRRSLAEVGRRARRPRSRNPTVSPLQGRSPPSNASAAPTRR